MKMSLLVAAFLALALTGCPNKKPATDSASSAPAAEAASDVVNNTPASAPEAPATTASAPTASAPK